METSFREPRRPIGPIRKLAGSTPVERHRARNMDSPRESRRLLPVELQIAADDGVPIESLMSAIDDAPADVSPIEALLGSGLIGEETYYQALAARLGCAYYSGSPPFAEDFDAAKGLVCGVAPLTAPDGGARAVIAPRAAVASRLIEMTLSGRLRPESFAVTSPQRFAALVRAHRSQDVLENALGRLPDPLSAKSGLSRTQAAFVGLVASLAVALGAASFHVLAMVASAALWMLFLASIGLRGVASVANPDEKRPRMLSDDELPIYTVVAALYREGAVVRQLVAALDALDYPKTKLDIKLVVERRDRATMSCLLALDLPARYEIVVAPPGAPSTKPRALNLALAEARGELLVVYDAEDIPAAEQLRLAASRFAADHGVDCLQARLTVRNPGDSWLSRGIMAQTPQAIYRPRHNLKGGNFELGGALCARSRRWPL